MNSNSNPSHRFSESETQALWRALRERRDMRHFNGAPMPEGGLGRLLEAARLAPSVGMMQPWRFIQMTDPNLRNESHRLVEDERLRTAAALPSRNEEFLQVKIEGIQQCSELLVAVLPPDREQHIIGRRTLPQMDLASLGCAIENMWLAARVEGIGLGWVSFFDPEAMAALLHIPAGALPAALLCIGPVDQFYPRPMFEEAGWGKRLAPEALLFENFWPTDAHGTPPCY